MVASRVILVVLLIENNQLFLKHKNVHLILTYWCVIQPIKTLWSLRYFANIDLVTLYCCTTLQTDFLSHLWQLRREIMFYIHDETIIDAILWENMKVNTSYFTKSWKQTWWAPQRRTVSHSPRLFLPASPECWSRWVDGHLVANRVLVTRGPLGSNCNQPHSQTAVIWGKSKWCKLITTVGF